MRSRLHPNVIIGITGAAVSAAALAGWVPFDTGSGLVEKVRRSTVIGDALAPSVALGFTAFGSVLLAVTGGQRSIGWNPAAVRFTLLTLTAVVCGFLVMLYAGPLAVALTSALGADTAEYRLLRDAPPWKYLGFFFGGLICVAGPISLSEGRLTVRILAVSAAAVTVIMALFDLPFDDLLLPPNGDY